MGVNDLDNDAFEDLYGRWAGRKPEDAVALMSGYPGTWWIAGGWALEAFTGVSRRHEDLDLSVLRAELPALRRHLARSHHVWAASAGSLTPLLPGERPDAAADDVLPEGCGQVWTRRNAREPWEYDVLLAQGTPTTWIYKRDAAIRMPMQRALWTRDGITYLQPEIQLLYKGRALREKDQIDFVATLPHLDASRREWLAGALIRTEGDKHPWLAPLGAKAP